MIANFWITQSNKQLISSELSQNKFYSANFLKIIIVFKESIKSSTIFELQTNLIERSGFNPMRTVSFFSPSIGQNYLNYEPTQKMYYKLSLSNFNAPVFILRNTESSELIEIKEIAVQLEIKETNGWI